MSFAIRISMYLVCLVVLVSCHNHSCHNQKVHPRLCLLTTIKDPQGRVLERFEYNQNGQLIKHYNFDDPMQITRTLQYNSAGQISQVIEGTKYYPVYWLYTYKYSASGREVIENKKCEVGNAFFRFTLQLNQNGLLTQYTHPDLEYIRYEYNQANDLHKVFFKSFGSADSEEFNIVQYDNFDDKPSPVSGSKSLQQYLQLVLKRHISMHNYRTYRYHFAAGVNMNDFWSTTDSISYTYNSQGYPTQINGISGSYRSLTYEYNCP